jgi:hypothetical protein
MPNYSPIKKIVKVKDSSTGKITQVTLNEKTGQITRMGNPVTLSKTQKILPSNQMKHGGPYNAHHPMKMKDSAYNMKSPYNMRPAILNHMSHNK